MLSSSRFVVAVHVLGLLFHYGNRGPVCSAVIAKSVNTNPVVIRRLMSQLECHKLVLSTTGRSGGFLLGRPAENISLADIYMAVEDEQFFRVHKSGNDTQCPISGAIMKALLPKLALASLAMTDALAHTTLNNIIYSLDIKATA